MEIQGVDIGFVSATEALADFYQRVLGLKRLEPRAFPFATVHRLAGERMTLKVMVPASTPDPAVSATPFWQLAGMRYLTLWVDDLEALSTAWAAAGGTVTMAPTELRPGVQSALLADPDGNAVEAMQDSAGAHP